MSYQCNCGKLFGSPEERAIHASNCPVLAEEKVASILMQPTDGATYNCDEGSVSTIDVWGLLREQVAKCQRHEAEAVEQAKADADKYREALEADAADLWRVTNAIKKEIQAREWIMEGRGSYAWDDDQYRDETRLAFEAVLKLISEVQHPAQLRFQEIMRGEMPEK